MIITQESQLGLRFKESSVKCEFLKNIRMYLDGRMTSLGEEIESFKEHGIVALPLCLPEECKMDFQIAHVENDLELRDRVLYKCINGISMNNVSGNNATSNSALFSRHYGISQCQLDFMEILVEEHQHSKYFFICESVYKAAELIRIGENFTSRTMKDIELGHYTYLMGKNQMVRFIVAVGAIKGFYYNDAKGIAFEFGLDLETGEYYYPKESQKEFSMLMQVLVFVELGEIETVYLEGGRNNGKSKNDGKVTNTSKNTIYVVDSSWNKLIIRTEGFSVSPHWRLQPCGPGHADRILILINAFWKNGYKRLPKAEMAR